MNQSSFTARRLLYALSIRPSLPPAPVFNSELCTECGSLISVAQERSGKLCWHDFGRKFMGTLRCERTPTKQRGLKFGPFGPTRRLHLASYNEQRPLQAIPTCWQVTPWRFACPACVKENTSLGEAHISGALWKGLPCPLPPWADWTCQICCTSWLRFWRKAHALWGGNHSDSVAGAKLGLSPLRGRRGQTVPMKE